MLGMARSLRSLHAAGAGLGARCTRPAPCQVPGARGGRGTSPLPAPGAGAPGLPRRVPAQPASPAAPAWLRDPPGGRAGIAPAGSGARWQPPAQLCYRLPLTVASELLGCTWADVPRDGRKGPAVRAALGAPSSAHPTPGTSPSHGTTKCLLPKPRPCRGWGWLCRWGGPSLGAAGSNKTSPRQRSVCSGSSRLHGPAHVMPADRCRAAPPPRAVLVSSTPAPAVTSTRPVPDQCGQCEGSYRGPSRVPSPCSVPRDPQLPRTPGCTGAGTFPIAQADAPVLQRVISPLQMHTPYPWPCRRLGDPQGSPSTGALPPPCLQRRILHWHPWAPALAVTGVAGCQRGRAGHAGPICV